MRTPAIEPAGGRSDAKAHGEWHFHVCRDPQVLEKELASLAAPSNAEASIGAR